MRKRLTVAGALVAAALTGAIVSATSAASSPGLIVFASDRDKANPGEIYSLARGRPPRDISRTLARESALAVAPVGDQIAFWSNRSGVDEVYLARIDGSHLRVVHNASTGEALTRADTRFGFGNDDTRLVFSNDGSRLFGSDGLGRWDPKGNVFVIDTRSATARRVALCGGDSQPSPDGNLVACGVQRRTTVFDASGRVRFVVAGAAGIWSSEGLLATTDYTANTFASVSSIVVDGSGTRVARFAGSAVAWSPDGRFLLVRRERGSDYHLWIGDLRNRHARVLLQDWSNGLVSFTPDGRDVSTTDGDGNALLIPVSGGRAVRGIDGGRGVWSRDGRVAWESGMEPRSVAPVERGDPTFPVFITDTHGRNPRVVGRFPLTGGVDELVWSPDGRQLLFLTTSYCGGDDLFAIPADGGTTSQLTHDPRDLETPSWSPDGTRIAYSAWGPPCLAPHGLESRIEEVLVNGSAPHPVTTATPQNGNPSFSPDGTRIAFSNNAPGTAGLQIVAASGGVPTPLPQAGLSASDPAWSPDGSEIAYDAGDAIMTIAPNGGSPESLGLDPATTTACQSTGGVAWSPDGTQLAAGGDDGIYLVTIGQPSSERLAIPTPCAEYPSFSPDGTQIAFDAPAAHALGGQTAIMVANTDGSNLRILSTEPFSVSTHPSWQPAP